MGSRGCKWVRRVSVKVEVNDSPGSTPLSARFTSLSLREQQSSGRDPSVTVPPPAASVGSASAGFPPAPSPWSHAVSSRKMPRHRRHDSEGDSHHGNKPKRARTSSRKKNDTESGFSTKSCVAWFREYTNADEEVIGPEGMEKFCEDIGVEPENIVMLSLAWKLNAEQMGFFTLAEWLRGMADVQCDSIAKLQSKLEYLRSLLEDSTTFKSIYRYAFDFARDKDQRSMDMDTAKAMLALLLGKNWPLFSSFHQFLEQSKYKVINKDQWCNVLEFSRLIQPDLRNYDEDGAWPVMLDEFVEWYRDQNGLSDSSGMNQ